MSHCSPRRQFLQQCFTNALLIAGFYSCETKEKKLATSTNPCHDYSDLNDDDIKKRKNFGFVEHSPTDNKHCGNCNLWLPPKAGEQCGKCQLFRGPVPAGAYCTYWAPQV